MAYEDLREFLQELEQMGDLVRVKKEVDGPDIYSICWKLNDKGGPAVLFENVKGYSTPVLAQTLASRNRWAMACGYPLGKTQAEYVSMFRDTLNKQNWKKPIEVSAEQAPCKEVIMKGDDVDLSKLPFLQWHPNDGGPFISMGITFMNDPEFGPNAGIYRIMVLDKKTTSVSVCMLQDSGIYMSRAKQKGKRSMEAAIVVGADPAVYEASTSKMPPRVDELEFAAAFRQGEPVKMVKCETVDINVPATAEIVLEGEIMFDETTEEGPYTELMGYWEEKMVTPTFKIRCITHRKNPILMTTCEGHIHSEGESMAIINQIASQELSLRKTISGYVTSHFPAGSRRYAVIVAIKKRYPGWGRQAIYQALSLPFIASSLNMVIVVDDDIDPTDHEQVMWALATRVDGERDVIVTKPQGVYPFNPAARSRPQIYEPTGVTDFALCSKIGIDATLKDEFEGSTRPKPVPIYPPKENYAKVLAHWKEYGFND